MADTGDTAWMIGATALVLLMTVPGLVLFYGGMVRAKNALSVLMQCFAITSLISVLWVIHGYSLAFDTSGMIEGELNLHSFVGALAEPMKFSALVVFVAIWFTLVYAPMAHMVWGGDGALMWDWGVMDFAGGAVVHINAGTAGLVAALLLGKRIGYPGTAMPPHSLTLTVVGGSLLWVGWFGFNAGSAVAANGTAGMAMLVTQVASAAAALAWMGTEWSLHGKPSALGLTIRWMPSACMQLAASSVRC